MVLDSKIGAVQSGGLKLFDDEMETYWDAIPIHVIDLRAARMRIVELGVVSTGNYDPTPPACRPQRKIPLREQSVHGISRE